jgi:high-affinity Fe2+/Pb2+ permease
MSSIEPVVSLPSTSEKTTERRQAFNFGAVIAIVCCGLGAWSLHRGVSNRGFALVAFGVAILLYSIVHPAGALVLRRAWLFIGGLLGRVNSLIILSVAYVFLLTPLSMLFRLFSRRTYRPRRGAPYFVVRSKRDDKHFEHPY